MHQPLSLDQHVLGSGAAAFSYAGEGPEIGKNYGYKITGFVTHEPPNWSQRIAAALQAAQRRITLFRLSTGDFFRRDAFRRRPERNRIKWFAALDPAHMTTAPRTLFAHHPLLLRILKGTIAIGRFTYARIAEPILQRMIYAAVRYPATVLAVTLACFLSSLLLRGEVFPAADTLADAAQELRLTTGSIGGGSSSRADRPSAASEPWKPLRGRQLPIFALEAPEFGALSQSYAIRTRAEAREDSLGWSEQGKQDEARWPPLAPLVLIVAQRQLQSDGDASSLYLDTTRRAAQYGLSVMRAATPSALSTKFGMVEVADVILSADAATPEEQSRSCLAFRHAKDAAIFRLAGWLCAPRDRVVVRPTLASLIDRLSLIGAGNDARLHQIFVEADRVRASAAGQRSVRKPLPWLDQEGERPQLKGERTAKAGKRA